VNGATVPVVDTPNATGPRTYDDEWQARANRAIIASRMAAYDLFAARQRALCLLQQSLRIHAACLLRDNSEDQTRLCQRIAEYYRAHGRLLLMSKRLSSRISKPAIPSL